MILKSIIYLVIIEVIKMKNLLKQISHQKDENLIKIYFDSEALDLAENFQDGKYVGKPSEY